MKHLRRHFLVIFLLAQLAMINYGVADTHECAQPSVHCGKTPSPVINTDGTLWVAYEYHDHIYVSSSTDQAKTFSTPVKITVTPEKIYTSGENRPKIALDNHGNIYVTWTEKTPGRFSGDIRFSRSLDNGQHFQAPITINSDKQLIGHRFDTLNVNHAGDITIAWLDKRDKVKAKANNQSYTGTAIYYATSKDHGETFSENIKIADHTCECCRIATTSDDHDNVTFLWRHIFNKNTRDHALVTINPDTTSQKVIRATEDEWNIDSCPHHGPDITYGSDDHLYYTWFTQGTNHQGILFGKFNTHSNKIISQQVVDAAASAANPQIIHINDTLINAWKRFNGEQTDVLARYSSNNGETWSTPIVLNSTQDASDHPLLISHHNAAYLSWHTKHEGYTLTEIALH